MRKFLNFIKQNYEKFIFVLLSIAILGPLLRPGYILTLDMIFTPKMAMHWPPTGDAYSTTPLMFILNLIVKIIPADIVQKITLLLIFNLIPFGFYKFLSVFELKGKFEKLLRVLAATLYLWNPFVYERLLAGHWLFLFGYALTPFFLLFLIRLYKAEEKRDIKKYFLLTIGTWFCASIISLHHFFLFGFIFTLFSVIFLIKTQGKSFAKFITTTVISFLVNFIWIFPTLLYSRNINIIGESDLFFFAPSADATWGVFGNLVTFYGFWAEKTLMLLPKNYIPMWPLAFILLLFPFIYLVIVFLPKKFKEKYKNRIGSIAVDKSLVIGIIAVLLLGLVLAHGSLGVSKPIYDIFYHKIPLLKAFRESQKFLSLYIFGFSTLFYISMQAMIAQLSKEKYNSIKENVQKKLNDFGILGLIVAYFALTFLITFQFFWGAFGQLSVTDYPRSWYELEQKAEKDEKILVLPYQSYAKFSFNERRIASPASAYFTSDVIAKTTLNELMEQRYDVECLCLDKEDGVDKWHEKLKKSGVSYVLVNKNDDWEDFSFLLDSNLFEKIIEDKHSYVLKVKV